MVAKDDIISTLNNVRDKAIELQRSIKQMTPKLEVDTGTSEGISLIHAKYATLMRYNLNLVKLAHARIRGADISNIAKELVEDLVALNKIRPIEKKIQYQIDVLLKTLLKKKAQGENDGIFRADMSALVLSDEEEEKPGDDDDVYRPPRIAEVAYDDKEAKQKRREEKEQERYQARQIRSEGVREMLNEIKGRPEELRNSERDGAQSKALQRMLREDEERRTFEEENFVRLNVTRKDKKRRRDIERAMEGPIMDGSDEFASLAAVAERVLVSKSKGDESGTKDKRNDRDEDIKMRRLEEITEQMGRDEGMKSAKSKRKKRRR